MVIYSYSGRWRKKNIFSKHNIIVFFAWRMGKHRQRRSTSAGRRPSRRMTAKESLRRPRNDLWILSAATNARRRTRGIILCKYNDATDGRRPVGENARDVDRAHEDRRNRKRVVGPAGACLRCLDRIRRTVDVTPCLNALDLRVLLAIRPRKNPSVHFSSCGVSSWRRDVVTTALGNNNNTNNNDVEREADSPPDKSPPPSRSKIIWKDGVRARFTVVKNHRRRGEITFFFF